MNILHGLVGLFLLQPLLPTAAMAAEPLPGSGMPRVAVDWSPPVILDQGPADVQSVTVDSDTNGTMVAVWVYLVNVPENHSHYYTSYFAQSFDRGASWSEPSELLPALSRDNVDRRGARIAAGENGIWMTSIVVGEHNLPYVPQHGVVISHDSGQTWPAIVDLSEKFPVTAEDPAYSAQLLVAYCGNSCWIVMQSTGRVVRYVRSTDDGVTWGSTIILQNQNPMHYKADIQSDPLSEAVLINYYEYDLPIVLGRPTSGKRVSRFSYDNGATFGLPIVSTVGGTDGTDNWILADEWVYGADSLRIRHSNNNGHSFRDIPGPPDLLDEIPNLQQIVPEKIVYSENGEIVVMATARYAVTISLRLQVPGLVTRTSDLGQTWTPWARLQDETGNVPQQALTAGANGFVSVMFGQPGAPETKAVYSRRLQPGPVSAARDWQLYQ